MTHTDMTKPFSTNPKLADWVPSEQQLQTITGARELLDLALRRRETAPTRSRSTL